MPKPTSQAPHPPYRLCVLGFPRLTQLIESVAPEFGARIHLVVENRRFGDAQAQAHALIEQQAVDAFISAGSNGAALRRALDYPVVLVGVTGQDMMAALVHAAALGTRIAMVSYEAVSPELADFSRLLRVELSQRRYREASEVAPLVAGLREAGHDVVIGPSLVVEAAEAIGLPAVLIYSRNSARVALEEALESARLRVREATRRAELSGILSRLAEGVLTIDTQQCVTLANRAACDLLHREHDALLGLAVSELLPGFREDRLPVREVFVLAGRRLLVQGQALSVEGTQVAAILTLQEAASVERAGRTLRQAARAEGMRARHKLADLSGDSAAIVSLRELAGRFAAIDLTVLIQGESGTGKELLAQGIHNASPRRDEPFVALNCAAMPETLIEAELFGHEEGAFTGAARGGRSGLLESAHHGTVFLDEVGDMPPALQVRLLRVLQEREVVRIGGREAIPVDIRLIAATHRDLRTEVAAGRFREDLYFRLNGLRLLTPALRDRREDLPGLAGAIVQRICQRKHWPAPEESVLQDFLARVANYAFPGNVRELENMLERLIAVAQGGAQPLPATLWPLILPELDEAPPPTPEVPQRPLQAARGAAEQAHLESVLRACNGHLGEAARQLGISRTTLWRKLRQPS